MAKNTAETTKTEDTYVPVYLPKRYKGDDEQLLSINGRRLLIQKGKTVMVPPEFAELIDNARMQEESSEAYMEQAGRKVNR